MNADLHLYLESLKGHLRLDNALRQDVAREVSTHLEAGAQDLVSQGVGAQEAERRTREAFGDPEAFAARMNDAYSQGTWLEAALAALPHLVTSLLFAWHIWMNPVWLFPVLSAAIVMSLMGWRHGRPVWVYPWLGYSLLPFLIVTLVGLSLVGQTILFLSTQGYSNLHWMAWAPLLLFLAFVLWLSSSLLLRVSRQDWVHASLMVLPLPVLAVSLLLLERWSFGRFMAADESSALMFLFLALATAAFVRLGRRLLKIGVLVVIMPGVLILAAHAVEGGPKPLLIVLVSLVALLLLLSPALVALAQAPRWSGASRPAFVPES